MHAFAFKQYQTKFCILHNVFILNEASWNKCFKFNFIFLFIFFWQFYWDNWKAFISTLNNCARAKLAWKQLTFQATWFHGYYEVPNDNVQQYLFFFFNVLNFEVISTKDSHQIPKNKISVPEPLNSSRYSLSSHKHA